MKYFKNIFIIAAFYFVASLVGALILSYPNYSGYPNVEWGIVGIVLVAPELPIILVLDIIQGEGVEDMHMFSISFGITFILMNAYYFFFRKK